MQLLQLQDEYSNQQLEMICCCNSSMQLVQQPVSSALNSKRLLSMQPLKLHVKLCYQESDILSDAAVATARWEGLSTDSQIFSRCSIPSLTHIASLPGKYCSQQPEAPFDVDGANARWAVHVQSTARGSIPFCCCKYRLNSALNSEKFPLVKYFNCRLSSVINSKGLFQSWYCNCRVSWAKNNAFCKKMFDAGSEFAISTTFSL